MLSKHTTEIFNFLSDTGIEELNKKEELAKRLFMSQGITFTVYSSGEDRNKEGAIRRGSGKAACHG